MADYLDSDLAIAEVDPVTQEIKATPYFEDYLYKVIATLGGEGSTLPQDLTKGTIDSPVLAAAIKQIQIDTTGFRGRVEITDYTAENKDWVEARSGITVGLPANPLVNHQVMVSNGDGTAITVDGNGNNIKYTSTDTSIISKRQGTSLHFQYFVDNVLSENYWRVQ